ncbi:MAG: hypothetical protein LBE08_13855 [Bifidobacteriaceae bacterium]|jgi:methionyl-tRNA formyltransferase|nr:hypothetical protein [Bifidobacteriaceae bacterium]
MCNSDARVLFLGKKDDYHCQRALAFVLANFSDVQYFLGEWGDPRPAVFDEWEGDYVVSYLSRWVVTPEVLSRVSQAAINFHPGSPSYPGIGCVNFALYEGVREYGVTCHHMAGTVDTGQIIAVSRLPVFPNDNVASLLGRTYDIQLALFYDIVGLILQGGSLPESEEEWVRPPFTRRDFNELCRVLPDMETDEIRRRVRATDFGAHGPSVVLAGYRFALAGQDPDPPSPSGSSHTRPGMSNGLTPEAWVSPHGGAEGALLMSGGGG